MIQVKSAPASALAGGLGAAVHGPVRKSTSRSSTAAARPRRRPATAAPGCSPSCAGNSLWSSRRAARRRLASCPYLLLDAGFGGARAGRGLRACAMRRGRVPPRLRASTGPDLVRRAWCWAGTWRAPIRLRGPHRAGHDAGSAPADRRLRLRDLELLVERRAGLCAPALGGPPGGVATSCSRLRPPVQPASSKPCDCAACS